MQALYELAAATLLEHKRHQRRHLAKRANDPRHEWMKRRRARETNHDATLFATRGAPRRRGGPIHLVEDGACALEEGGARVSELNPSRFATEQLNFELLLKSPDLQAERGLLDA